MPTLLRIGETGINLDLVIEWIVSPEPNNSISLCLLFAVPEWPHDEHPAAHLEPFSLVFFGDEARALLTYLERSSLDVVAAYRRHPPE